MSNKLGDVKLVKEAIVIEVKVDIEGSERFEETYTPPKGWYIDSYEVHKGSKRGDSSFRVSLRGPDHTSVYKENIKNEYKELTDFAGRYVGYGFVDVKGKLDYKRDEIIQYDRLVASKNPGIYCTGHAKGVVKARDPITRVIIDGVGAAVNRTIDVTIIKLQYNDEELKKQIETHTKEILEIAVETAFREILGRGAGNDPFWPEHLKNVGIDQMRFDIANSEEGKGRIEAAFMKILGHGFGNDEFWVRHLANVGYDQMVDDIRYSEEGIARHGDDR